MQAPKEQHQHPDHLPRPPPPPLHVHLFPPLLQLHEHRSAGYHQANAVAIRYALWRQQARIS